MNIFPASAPPPPRGTMLRLASTLGLMLALIACGQNSIGGSASTADLAASASAPTIVERAAADTAIDSGACLAIAEGARSADESACPAFIHEAFAQMLTTCADAGGKLVPFDEAVLRSLDVDGDGQRELLFDGAEMIQCENAWSIFSCGSLGCPVAVMARSGDRWQPLGWLNASDSIGTEVLAPSAGQTYRTLRGGCNGDTPCAEWTYYEWTGSGYERTMIEARGHRVDVAPGGLWTLSEATDVLAAPLPGGTVIERYPASTEVVRIGDARGAPYVYVSPCNACERGFVPEPSLRKVD